MNKLHDALKDITPQQWGEILKDVLIFGLPGKDGKDGQDGQSIRGEKGEQGPQGEKGERGDAGDKGEKGDIGPGGPQGQKGQTGERGEIGERGQPGKDGKDGRNGRDAILDLEFSINGREWHDVMVQGTRYMRFIINGRPQTIDFTKIYCDVGCTPLKDETKG